MSGIDRRRLTNRHFAEGEVAQASLQVSRADCEGIVDGVLVDFRHPDLVPGEWEARAFWHVGSESEGHCGFLFPKEAAYCEAVMATGDFDEIDRDSLEMSLGLPRANAGDALTVENVITKIDDRYFDHPHDKTVKHAYLLLTRPTGEMVRPSTPLVFFGVTQLRRAQGYNFPQRDAYDRLAERILWRDPQAEDVSPSEGSLAGYAQYSIERAERAWGKLMELHLANDSAGQAALRQALNYTALAGFFQAKHELRKAETTASTTVGNLREGPRSQRAWDRTATATQIWQKHPDWSRTHVAKEVIAELGLGTDKFSSVMRSLKNHQLDPKRGE